MRMARFLAMDSERRSRCSFRRCGNQQTAAAAAAKVHAQQPKYMLSRWSSMFSRHVSAPSTRQQQTYSRRCSASHTHQSQTREPVSRPNVSTCPAPAEPPAAAAAASPARATLLLPTTPPPLRIHSSKTVQDSAPPPTCMSSLWYSAASVLLFS